jgi:uncharacterized protein (TIGR02147 family)
MHENAPSDTPRRPEILDYMDYRLFLRDHLDWLQGRDRKYSQRWVARRAGFKAPQLLSMILKGDRNLAKDKVPELAAALKLAPQETEYLQFIVELAQCTSHQEQRALIDRIQTIFRNGLFAPLEGESVEVFRDWYYPAIREIVTIEGLDASAAAIGARLGITAEEAEAAIALLVARGLLRRTEGGRLERADPSIRTVNEKVYRVMFNAWHLKMLEMSFTAMHLDRDVRHFEGLTFAVPRRLMPQLRQAIERFFRELDFFVEAQTGRDEVMHVHLALFPLTRWGGAERRAGASTAPAAATKEG